MTTQLQLIIIIIIIDVVVVSEKRNIFSLVPKTKRQTVRPMYVVRQSAPLTSSFIAQLKKNVTNSSVWTFCRFAQPPSLEAVNTRDPSNLASNAHSRFSDRNWKLTSVVDSRDWFLTSTVTPQQENSDRCLFVTSNRFIRS